MKLERARRRRAEKIGFLGENLEISEGRGPEGVPRGGGGYPRASGNFRTRIAKFWELKHYGCM